MSAQDSLVAGRIEKPWVALLLRWQFERNCLASVAIEVPALRRFLPGVERPGAQAGTASQVPE